MPEVPEVPKEFDELDELLLSSAGRSKVNNWQSSENVKVLPPLISLIGSH